MRWRAVATCLLVRGLAHARAARAQRGTGPVPVRGHGGRPVHHLRRGAHRRRGLLVGRPGPVGVVVPAGRCSGTGGGQPDGRTGPRRTADVGRTAVALSRGPRLRCEDLLPRRAGPIGRGPPGWDTFTLPDGEVVAVGGHRRPSHGRQHQQHRQPDPAARGGAVDLLPLHRHRQHRGEHDPTGLLRARGNVGPDDRDETQVESDVDAATVFDGRTDVHTFRYDGFARRRLPEGAAPRGPAAGRRRQHRGLPPR